MGAKGEFKAKLSGYSVANARALIASVQPRLALASENAKHHEKMMWVCFSVTTSPPLAHLSHLGPWSVFSRKPWLKL
ncbi:unnamed protein product [Camellia sinensis]